jgi:hypothetical protein
LHASRAYSISFSSHNEEKREMTARTTVIETLEARQMMSVSPLALAVNTAMVDGGLQLRVAGTANADNIAVTLARNGLRVTNGSWTTVVKGAFKSILLNAGSGNDKVVVGADVTASAALFGGKGNDTLVGGAGNDKIYGQLGNDNLQGGAGDDVLVNVGGGTLDRTTGGKGFDSFWTDSSENVVDATAGEVKGGAVHRVSGFYTTGTNDSGDTMVQSVRGELTGGDLADPGVDDESVVYKNFSNNPLFASTGPSADDIVQGYVGDCWYLSTLAAIARTNPNAIRQAVVELGDGTYAVQFKDDNGATAFVRVDGDLPQNDWGDLEYAGLGKQDSIWVAIMEKAYASFREAGVSDYASLDGGWMSEAFGDLGYDSNHIWDVKSGNDLLNKIDAELKAGKAVTIAIYEPAAGASLIGSHAYTVVAVETDANGVKTLVVRNPWGIDGAGHDGKDDGYVRVTATQAYQSFWGVISANVG